MHRRIERLRVNGKHYRARSAGIRKRRDLGQQRPHIAASVLEFQLRSDLLRLAPRTARRLDRGVPHQVANDKAPATSDLALAADKNADAGPALQKPFFHKRVDGLARSHATDTALIRYRDLGAEGLARLHRGDMLAKHIRDARVERRPPPGFHLFRHDESRLA